MTPIQIKAIIEAGIKAHLVIQNPKGVRWAVEKIYIGLEKEFKNVKTEL